MHVPTHILSGWVAANAFPLTAAERLGCMIAASIADLDGLGIIFGEATYQRWHHVVCHNLPFGLLSAAVTALITTRGIRRLPVAGLYLALFHLHLLMDYWGSGPGWPITYWWPFSDFRLVNWRGWELSSWQNTLAAAVLLGMTVLIAVTRRRTPLERLMPSLDRQLVPNTPVDESQG